MGLLLVLGCGGGGVLTLDGGEPTFEVVATGLEVPWAIAFTSPTRILVTERPGRVRQVIDGDLAEEPLLTLTPAIGGEAGLMGIAVHPNYVVNKWVYVSYVNSATGVRIERYRDTGTRLVEPLVILDGIPGAFVHVGCRMKFGPDGKLYATTGDATGPSLAQDLGSLAGKTLRLNDDGSSPDDNPFTGQAGARSEIWSYGHRNAQGIAWQPGSGLMFQTEHGPSGGDGPPGGDEVNIVEKGLNYGWPVISHSETEPGMVSPLIEYTPAVAPAGATFVESPRYAKWNGDLMIACLRGNALRRLSVRGREIVGEEDLATGFGRVRDVVQGPDGFLYLSTSNRDGRGTPNSDDDKIIRVLP